MKESAVRFEKIKPRLKPGQVSVLGSAVEFVRTEDQVATSFSEEALFYLQQFVLGQSVEDIINDCYKRHSQINFELLQQTLLKLYWADNLLNNNEFRSVVEFSEWLPSVESHLIHPFIEFELRKTFLSQILTLGIPLILVAFSLKIFSSQQPPLYSLLLFPLTFFNIKGIISALGSALFNKTPQLLSLHISFFGIYLKESSGRRSSIGVFEYLLNLGSILIISTFSIYYFLRSEDLLFRDLGAILSVLTCCLLMSPSHKTDFSNFYSFMETKFKDKLTQPFLKTQLRIMFLNSTGLFLLLSLSFFLLSAFTIAQYTSNLLVCGIIVALVAGFFLDLLDDFDFILDQIQGYFISPLRTLLAHFIEKKFDVVASLKDVSIFESLPLHILSEMTKSSKVISVRKGVVLCKEGQRSTDLFLVIRGRVGIYKHNERNLKFKVLELTSGSIFGEGGFFLDKPRSGDAITLSNSYILKIARPSLLSTPNSVPGNLAEMFQKKIWAFQALARSSFFKDVPSELLMQVVSQSKLYEPPPFTIVVQQGTSSDSMWVILEGSASVTIDGQKRRELTVGDVFGEIGIIWNSLRTSSVVTEGQSSLLRIDASVLQKMFSTNIDLGVELQKLGSSRLESDPVNS